LCNFTVYLYRNRVKFRTILAPLGGQGSIVRESSREREYHCSPTNSQTQQPSMMRLFLRGFQIVLPILLALDTAQAQGGGGVATCSGVRTRYPAPSLGQCLTSWADSRREQKLYPDDFQGILNKAEIYVCPSSRKRVIISNGIPDHSVTLQNNLAPCEVNWAVEVCT
jgi:hypothetical protein